MEKSIRGVKLTEEEQKLVTSAYSRAPKRYGKLHKEVREEAQKEMMLR